MLKSSPGESFHNLSGVLVMNTHWLYQSCHSPEWLLAVALCVWGRRANRINAVAFHMRYNIGMFSVRAAQKASPESRFYGSLVVVSVSSLPSSAVLLAPSRVWANFARGERSFRNSLWLFSKQNQVWTEAAPKTAPRVCHCKRWLWYTSITKAKNLPVVGYRQVKLTPECVWHCEADVKGWCLAWETTCVKPICLYSFNVSLFLSRAFVICNYHKHLWLLGSISLLKFVVDYKASLLSIWPSFKHQKCTQVLCMQRGERLLEAAVAYA